MDILNSSEVYFPTYLFGQYFKIFEVFVVKQVSASTIIKVSTHGPENVSGGSFLTGNLACLSVC